MQKFWITKSGHILRVCKLTDIPRDNQIELFLYGETTYNGHTYTLLEPDNKVYGKSIIDTVTEKRKSTHN